METITFNLAANVRHVTRHGRDYIVVPLTMMVPGVLNGSKGALYYPPEEIAKDYQAWNGIPIVVNHPHDPITREPVSARDPEVLANYEVGRVYKTRADGKLTAEGWFDAKDTERVSPSVYASLKAGKRIELSTGLFTENELAPEGSHHNGKPYAFVAKNYRPDHLAILPDYTGACSIRDGCGVLVNKGNDDVVDNVKKKDTKGFTSSQGDDHQKGDIVEVEGKGKGTFKKYAASGDAIVTMHSDGDDVKVFPGKVKAVKAESDTGSGGSCAPGQTAKQTGCTPKDDKSTNNMTTPFLPENLLTNRELGVGSQFPHDSLRLKAARLLLVGNAFPVEGSEEDEAAETPEEEAKESPADEKSAEAMNRTALAKKANKDNKSLEYLKAHHAHREAASAHEEAGNDDKAAMHRKMAMEHKYMSDQLTSNSNPEGINQYTKGGGAGEEKKMSQADKQKDMYANSAKRAMAATDEAAKTNTAEAHEKAAQLHKQAVGYNPDSRDWHKSQAQFHARKAKELSKSTNNREDDMDRNEIIEHLTTNCDCWKGDDGKETLNALSDDRLKLIKEDHDKTLTANRGKGTTNTPAPGEELMSESDWLAKAPSSVKATLNYARTIEQKEKDALVARIVVNIKGTENKTLMVNKLRTKSIPELQEWLMVAGPTPNTPTQNQGLPAYYMPDVPGFSPVPTVNDENDILALPTMDFGTTTQETA